MKTNKRIACVPLENPGSVTANVSHGVATIKQLHTLHRLDIVYDTEDGRFQAGGAVWVKGDVFKHPLHREVYEIEKGKRFILLPYEFVVVEAGALTGPTPVPGPGTNVYGKVTSPTATGGTSSAISPGIDYKI